MQQATSTASTQQDHRKGPTSSDPAGAATTVRGCHQTERRRRPRLDCQGGERHWAGPTLACCQLVQRLWKEAQRREAHPTDCWGPDQRARTCRLESAAGRPEGGRGDQAEGSTPPPTLMQCTMANTATASRGTPGRPMCCCGAPKAASLNMSCDKACGCGA